MDLPAQLEQLKSIEHQPWCPVFVTGTDTDIGKTYLSGFLAKALQDPIYGNNTGKWPNLVGYYKAAISGAVDLEHSDASFVKHTAGLSQDVHTMTPYHFVEPLSPHLAAERTGKRLTLETILEGFKSVYTQTERLVFEGTGGLFCPFGETTEPLLLDKGERTHLFTILDIMRLLNSSVGLSVVLVGNSGLGSINHITCSYQCLLQAGFTPQQILIVMNNFDEHSPMHQSNLATVKRMDPVAGIFTVAQNADATTVFTAPSFVQALLSTLK